MSEYIGQQIDSSLIAAPSSGKFKIIQDSNDGKLKKINDLGQLIDLEAGFSFDTIVDTTSNVTISQTDHRKVFNCTDSVVFTLPNGLPTGVRFFIANTSNSNGVTLEADGTLIEKDSLFAIEGNGGFARCVHLGGNEWLLEGDTITDQVPLSIPSIYQWLDFGDVANTNIVSGRYEGVTDKSGTVGGKPQQDIEQLTVSLQAQRILGGLNSLNVARFNLAEYYDLGNDIGNVLSSEWSLFIVCRHLDGGVGPNNSVYRSTQGTQSRSGFAYNQGSNELNISWNGQVSNINQNSQIENFSQYSLIAGASTVTIRQNRNIAGSTSKGSSTNFNSVAIGARNINGTPSHFFEGEIAEIILYNRALNTSERQNLEDFFTLKWGVV